MLNYKKQLGLFLLAIWVIAINALPLLNLGSNLLATITQCVGIAAGVLLILGR